MFKPRIRIRIGKFGADIGWFSGEPFVLFGLLIGEEWASGDGVTLFDLTVAKFAITLFVG